MIFDSYYSGRYNTWKYYIGTTDGSYREYTSSYEQRCNCSQKYKCAGTDSYSAVCSTIADNSAESWQKQNTCPKGWGRYRDMYPSDTYSVRNGQGYIKGGTEQRPVYGYVTRYRDAYRNYIATRIAKS